MKKFDGVIPLEKVELKYVASGGPGGQHVNKSKFQTSISEQRSQTWTTCIFACLANSKAELRFHVASATWLADKARLVFTEQQRHRINKDGYYIVISERTRSQLQNQADVLDRLREAVSAAYRTAFEPARDPEEVQAEEQMKLRRFNRAARYRLREKRMASADKRWRQYDSKDWWTQPWVLRIRVRHFLSHHQTFIKEIPIELSENSRIFR